MIAVLASEHDRAAQALVAAWGDAGAVLLSARDLCSPGWIFQMGQGATAQLPEQGSFVAGGKVRPVAGLRGVLLRRPAVAAEELHWIDAEDRSYVASEINAFLVAWLSALRCTVLNRPTATSLCGPAWSPLHWRVQAARAGVAWTERAQATQELVFCGGRYLGQASAEQLRAAQCLSKASGASLLGLLFAGDALAAVSVQPRLDAPPLRALVLSELLQEPQAAHAPAWVQ